MNTALRWLERARDAIDERGRGAWIAVTVISFVLFWPIGFALLAYILWSKRMSCHSWGRMNHHRRATERMGGRTGNSAFDSYREETLKRLEEERDAFLSFLEQLRAAKDRAEFDQFMTGRQAPEAA